MKVENSSMEQEVIGDNVDGANERKAFFNPLEGPAMLLIGILGTLLNIVCLAVLSHNKELKLSPNYICLLRAQCTFDLLYLLTSTPVTALPFISQAFFQDHLMYILPWVFPFVQITMLASIYNIIALAIERYLSIRNLSVTHWFPCRAVIASIGIFSILISMPRFFELHAVIEEKTDVRQVNDTGYLHIDYMLETKVRHLIKPKDDFYTVGYFIGYNMIGSFLISLFIPVLTLSIFNMLIWKRLKQIWNNQTSLGIKEKRNAKAALSLVLIVIMFFICHSVKLIISGYQVIDSLITSSIRSEWPFWMEICTFISHFLLAINSSLNILVFCMCDKRFFLVVQKMFRSWFVILFCACKPSNNNEETMLGNMAGAVGDEEGEEEAGRGPITRSFCDNSAVEAVEETP